MRMVKSEKALRVRRKDWKEIYQNANSGWRWWCVLREGIGLAHLPAGNIYLIMQAYNSQSWLKRKLPVTLQEQIELVVLEARVQGIRKVAGGAKQKRVLAGNGRTEMAPGRPQAEHRSFFDQAWERL